MKIFSTYFERKYIYKEIWVSPGAKTVNQNHHFLIESKHAKNLRSYGGANLEADHFMI